MTNTADTAALKTQNEAHGFYGTIVSRLSFTSSLTNFGETRKCRAASR